MREISPDANMTTDEYLDVLKREDRESWKLAVEAIEKVRARKEEGSRSKPSRTLIDPSSMLSDEKRKKLLDKVAELTDENAFGRSDMCRQFASLLQRALVHLGYSDARVVVGTVVYYNAKGETVFQWPDGGDGAHDWVEIGDEVIDGNADSMPENPAVAEGVIVSPYWGPRDGALDRRFIKDLNVPCRTADEDVEKIWWPELEVWLNENMR